MTAIKLAVPTMGAAGLDAERSGHFGHCDCFTIVTIVDGEITEVDALDNPPHEEGGCLRPVSLLHDAGVDAIVAAGMGMRPMMGFADAWPRWWPPVRCPPWARRTPATTRLRRPGVAASCADPPRAEGPSFAGGPFSCLHFGGNDGAWGGSALTSPSSSWRALW